MNAATTPGCINCGVVRCGNCQVEAHKLYGPSWSHRREETRERTDRPAASKGTRKGSATQSEAPKSLETTAGQISKTSESQQQALPQRLDLRRALLDMENLPKHQGEKVGNLAGAVDTGTSDAENVVSTGSSTPTLVDPGAVEAFARSIMIIQSLGYLWPQLVARCDTKERCIHVIERLLKRYATDLTVVTHRMQPSKMSDSKLCLTAARFVRRSRLHIAHEIWEVQAQHLENSEKNAMDHDWASRIPVPELGGDDEGFTDDDLIFDNLQDTLFSNGPILSLQANIKLLIKLPHPTGNSFGHRLPSSVETFIGNAISSLYEPPLSPSLTRLRYTCVSVTISRSTSLVFYRCVQGRYPNDFVYRC